MSKKYKNSSTAEYTRVYENLRGVDLSIVPSRDSRSRFSYLENRIEDRIAGMILSSVKT